MVDIGKTILLIEDDIGFQKSVADELINAGFRVLVTSDGKAGLDTALSEHPDLILLDIMLPKMNGLDVLKALRVDSWGKNVQVIILTALEANEKIMKELTVFDLSYYVVKKGSKLQDITAKIKSCLKIK